MSKTAIFEDVNRDLLLTALNTAVQAVSRDTAVPELCRVNVTQDGMVLATDMYVAVRFDLAGKTVPADTYEPVFHEGTSFGRSEVSAIVKVLKAHFRMPRRVKLSRSADGVLWLDGHNVGLAGKPLQAGLERAVLRNLAHSDPVPNDPHRFLSVKFGKFGKILGALGKHDSFDIQTVQLGGG